MEEQRLYEELGLRLKKARIARHETQADLGARAGVSRQLIARMEQGDSSVALAKWVGVSAILGLIETWENVLAVPADPFEEFDRRQQELLSLKKTRVRKK